MKLLSKRRLVTMVTMIPVAGACRDTYFDVHIFSHYATSAYAGLTE